MNLRVCFFTGSRAEYGLLKPIMRNILSAPGVDLQVVVSGSHLADEYGATCDEVEGDGFAVSKKVDIELHSDSPAALCRSMGMGLTGYGKALEELQPDIIVILGDRYESFTMAAAATVCRIPIAHIHGGEVTQGAIDEAFRHSISKMSHLHFTCAEEYRRRVIQLGEHPDRVFNVGSLGAENIRSLHLLAKSELEKQMGFPMGERCLLITYHPVTLEKDTAAKQFQNLLEAVDGLEDVRMIFTKANADPDGMVINRMIDTYVAAANEKAVAFTSMGHLRYLSAMKYAAAVVGNSSSGIIEAPSFRVPVVNIGDRQKGRIRADNVIDCGEGALEIEKALRKALSHEFRESLTTMQNPFEKDDTAGRIVEIIRNADLNEILKKEFFTIKTDTMSHSQ